MQRTCSNSGGGGPGGGGGYRKEYYTSILYVSRGNYMSGYKTILCHYIKGKHVRYHFEKEIILPFPPFWGLSIGHPDDEDFFYLDEKGGDEIHWEPKTETFFLLSTMELEDDDNADHTAEVKIKNGWKDTTNLPYER